MSEALGGCESCPSAGNETKAEATIATANAPLERKRRKIDCLRTLTMLSAAAALFSLFESIEQARGICPRERIQAMGLALLDGITRDGPFSAKKLGFLFHLIVPPVLV